MAEEEVSQEDSEPNKWFDQRLETTEKLEQKSTDKKKK